MDNREYRAAVDAFGDMVYRIALNQTRSAADADDVTQAVFLKLYEKPPKDAAGEHLKAWLIRVTVNECKSLWRTVWRQRVELREVEDADMPAFSEPDHEALYAALGALPEKCRIVVHLFYFEDYRTAEIAAILGIKEPTVRTRLARARKLLKEQLKEAWEDDEPDPEPGTVPSYDERRPCSC
ncbi:RNA polymerase sigma factor [uncultured Adlercreutzia sp.]|uniref:RNA polymerase sigma factor n=1 Tax=uncultured Adlercreutzia sp. TaxID=875803 RepID=UPI0026F3EDF1|nr:RNA polymerase sigma factor [uncultured Adlercreutzia sp.]